MRRAANVRQLNLCFLSQLFVNTMRVYRNLSGIVLWLDSSSRDLMFFGDMHDARHTRESK